MTKITQPPQTSDTQTPTPLTKHPEPKALGLGGLIPPLTPEDERMIDDAVQRARAPRAAAPAQNALTRPRTTSSRPKTQHRLTVSPDPTAVKLEHARSQQAEDARIGSARAELRGRTDPSAPIEPSHLDADVEGLKQRVASWGPRDVGVADAIHKGAIWRTPTPSAGFRTPTSA